MSFIVGDIILIRVHLYRRGGYRSLRYIADSGVDSPPPPAESTENPTDSDAAAYGEAAKESD